MRAEFAHGKDYTMAIRPYDGGSPQRCRKWLVRVSYKDGAKYRIISRTVHGPKREAERVEAEIKAGLVKPRGKKAHVAFGDAAMARIAAREERGEIAESTAVVQRSMLRKLSPILSKDVSSVTSEDISACVDGLKRSYALAVVSIARGVLRDYGGDDALKGVELPPKERSEREVRSRVVRSVAKIGRMDSVHSQMVAFCARTGMRRGEVCALRWQDVDLDSGTVSIASSISRSGERTATKTESSDRQIPIAPTAEETLELACASAVARGFAVSSASPVFPDDSGGFVTPDYLTGWWIRHRDRLGFSGVRLHDIRHSFLSELARQGAPAKTVQAIAGHTSFATTMDIYVHADMRDKRKAMGMVDW